ncbi:DUF427-domain-containing protein [Atractiella rhizophila]|nr:DUF427-domain-containing protein [Atractiella rhizophila]
MPTVIHKVSSTTIANSASPTTVEGNFYFPPSDVETALLIESPTDYTCPWKGKSQYWSLKLPSGEVIQDVAWSYPTPKEKANHIKGFFAFDKKKLLVE